MIRGSSLVLRFLELSSNIAHAQRFKMRTRHAVFAVMGVFVVGNCATNVCAQDKLPLKLIQTIPMPNVKGRMDHLGVDVKGKRIFAAALDNNTLEVIDLKAGKRIFSIPAQSKPQGVFYSPDFKRLFVANGTDGTCKIFSGNGFKLIDSLSVGTNPSHVGYDPATKYLYVGVGVPRSEPGALAIVDTHSNKHIGDIKTEVRPGGVKIERSGARIFVTLRGQAKVGVVDKTKREEIATWPMTGAPFISALAFDETHHRLFGGTRNPSILIVFDTESGKQITQLEGVNGIDDLWYDAAHKRIYASGGRDADAGFVFVYQQGDADHYELTAKVPTRVNAQTSIWVPELNRYYISASANDREDAAILVFEPQP
jgi:DNA-binding beta-propeller fold protein YncE